MINDSSINNRRSYSQENVWIWISTLIISNKELEDIMKIINSLDDSGLLIKGVSETIKNEARGQKEEFLGMSLGTLVASLLGNLLTGKVIIRARKGTNRANESF